MSNKYEIIDGLMAIYVYKNGIDTAEYFAETHGGWVGFSIKGNVRFRFLPNGDTFYSRSEVYTHIAETYKIDIDGNSI